MTIPRYRVSHSGRKALEAKDLSVPSDYRTILWVMEFQGVHNLEPLMRMFPEQALADCLAEMEELRLIERLAAPGEEFVESTASEAQPPRDVAAVTTENLLAARDVLSQQGAWLAEGRLGGWQPIDKPPSETAILIVEDDQDQLALADLRVSMAGYRVRVANSQATMLRSIAQQGIPDLVLLDVMLPDGDGFDILARMRRLRSFTAMPIVMLTAKTELNNIVKGFTLGADGYITKPYSKTILASVIRRILDAR